LTPVPVGGLSIGQRFLERKSSLPTLNSLPPLFIVLAIAFLSWRWSSIGGRPDPVTQSWLFDKWHLGPLRLINFAVTASVVATFLKYAYRWEKSLRPFLLIGRHMLPVFCCEICLSVLLIGRAESPSAIEPTTSVLVICQLLTAPLFAWLLEWRSTAQHATTPIPQPLAIKRPLFSHFPCPTARPDV
jgi:OpgC protein